MCTGIYCWWQIHSARSVVSGDISLMPIFVGCVFAGEVMSNESAVIENVSFLCDRKIFCMKFPTGFTYQNLHSFARFPGDSTAVVNTASIVAAEKCPLSY